MITKRQASLDISQPSFKSSKTSTIPQINNIISTSLHFQSWKWLLSVVILILLASSSDASTTVKKTIPFNGMILKATSHSVFWMQERVQAPGSVDLQNMTFSIVLPFDDDDGGDHQNRRMESLVVGDHLHSESSSPDTTTAARRKTRKRSIDNKQKSTSIDPPPSNETMVAPQPPQQVIETVLVPVPKHCGTSNNNLWGNLKLPGTRPKKQQQKQTCDWQQLGIGIKSNQPFLQASEDMTTAHHYCCSQAAIDEGICDAKQLGRLLLNSQLIVEGINYQQVVIPTEDTNTSLSWPNLDVGGFSINYTGDYIWVLANCLDDGVDVVVDGTLDWISANTTKDGNPKKTGLENLVHSIKQGPQSKKPTFPEDGLVQIVYFVIMSTLYGILGMVWWLRRRWQIENHHGIAILLAAVASLQLALASLDLYVWGGRSGSLDLWVWDGPERDEVLRHSALVLGAFKAGMIRWLVLLQFVSLPIRTLGNENQRHGQRCTQLWVTALCVIFTINCIIWGIVSAMAKDNLQNIKMLMHGEEKLWLKATAVTSAIALLLDVWAYLWSCVRFIQRFCRVGQRSTITKSSWVILLLVTAHGIFLIYTMVDDWKINRKIAALFVWDQGNIRILTEGSYFIVTSCLESRTGNRTSIAACHTHTREDQSDDCNGSTHRASGKAAREVEMAPLIA
ncbi:unnamed protein product [Cylindrotheca closterium]|uniref:Uncharacterized protein n=1 Tax=Cylindrotheca closterium TaxID=2856 RepID=A0AAD2JMM5_9STRA|nr:unnamed protein product [Cylindrotheca closterium]